MSRGLLIAGGVLGGGALLALALREREAIGGAVTVAIKVVDESARKAAARVAGKVITDKVLGNFRTYGIPALIESARDGFPWALAAAIVEVESGGDPGIYNYYLNGVGKSPKKVGYWRAGQPLPDGKDGRPHAWAAGLCQIIRKFPRGLTLAERLDPAKSLGVMLLEWRDFTARASKAGLTGASLWSAIYFGHNQGIGNLIAGLKYAGQGIAAVIKQAPYPNVKDKAARAAAALGMALTVAARVPLWAAVESQMKVNS